MSLIASHSACHKQAHVAVNKKSVKRAAGKQHAKLRESHAEGPRCIPPHTCTQTSANADEQHDLATNLPDTHQAAILTL